MTWTPPERPRTRVKPILFSWVWIPAIFIVGLASQGFHINFP